MQPRQDKSHFFRIFSYFFGNTLYGWFLALGPVAFYDTNFEVFGLREPLTDARKDALLAAHTAHQRFLFTVMLLANLCLLGACGYLFFRARR